MKLDAALPPVPLSAVPAIARAAEEIGFSALWCAETIHDPFLPGALIAEHTRRLNFGTAVTVSFARSPAVLAYTAWDLAQASGGRFILGVGTQVRAHIVRRFGMPWPPSAVEKLREQIAAMRAFWHCWQSGGALDFRGKHYQLNLMTPFFNPGPIDTPEIPIYMAGVNTGLARLAGEVADGFLVHPFHSLEYLQEIILPAVQQGAESAGRIPTAVSRCVTCFAVCTPEEAAFARIQLAFYASTPSYRPVMAHHGWGETADKLSRLATRQRWADMPALISDEMLATFALLETPANLPQALFRRYQGLADRLTLYLPFVPGEKDEFWKALCRQQGA